MSDRLGDQILSLSARTTSPNYLDAAQLEAYAGRDDRHLYGYLDDIAESGVTELGSTDLDRTDCAIRGFALTGVYALEAFRASTNADVDRIFAETPIVADDFPLAKLKVAAVDPDYQSRGIGTALTATAMANLFSNPPVVAMIWQRDNPANVKIARQYADNHLLTFENYFGEDWLCPDCGFDAECTCRVVLYGWFADGRSAQSAPDPTAAPAAEQAKTVNE